jgi:glycosyltransferase involved in cell wall biosynthesis
MISKILAKHSCPNLLITSCPHALKRYRIEDLRAKKFWFCKTDPVSFWSLLIFPFTGLILFIAGFFWFSYLKLKGYKIVLLARLQEKVTWTLWAKIFGFKIIWTEHSGFGRWLKKNPLIVLYRLWSRWVTIMVPSKEMATQLKDISISAKARVEVVANGLREGWDLAKLPRSRKIIIDHYNLSLTEDTLILGYVGRLALEKGLDYLLSLAFELERLGVDFYLLLAGEGELEDYLRLQIMELDLEKRVKLCGFLAEEKLKQFYLALDCLLLFSDHETFGLTVIEAFSARVVPIVHQTGALVELVKDEETGLIVNRKLAQENARLVASLQQDPEKLKQLRANIEQEFRGSYTNAIFEKRIWEILTNPA